MATKKKKKPTQKLISVDKVVEKLEPLCIARDVKWCSCFGKQYGSSFKKYKIELPYNLEISALDIYPKELKAGS